MSYNAGIGLELKLISCRFQRILMVLFSDWRSWWKSTKFSQIFQNCHHWQQKALIDPYKTWRDISNHDWCLIYFKKASKQDQSQHCSSIISEVMSKRREVGQKSIVQKSYQMQDSVVTSMLWLPYLSLIRTFDILIQQTAAILPTAEKN